MDELKMDNQMDEDKMLREEADDKLVNDAFQRLLDSYLASLRLSTLPVRHTRESDDSLASHTSCTPLP